MRHTAQYIAESSERNFSLRAKKPRPPNDGRGRHPNSIKNLAPYKKGQTGNPGGKPHDVAAYLSRQIIEENQEAIYAGMAAEVIAGKPYAFDVIANRAYGKVKETLDVNVSGTLKLASALEERRVKRAKVIENTDTGESS